MELPNSEKAYVERKKITEYLLNPEHRYGAHKARFFGEFGFRLDAWPLLAQALREHGKSHVVTNARKTGFGSRYEIDGPLKTPTGQRPLVRTVWQMDIGEESPRLITAYPLEKER